MGESNREQGGQDQLAMAIESLEDAMVILDCGEYLVATLNMSTHAKKSNIYEERLQQQEELKKALRLNILELAKCTK